MRDELQEGNMKKAEAEKVVAALIGSLGLLVDDNVPMTNGHSEQAAEQVKTELTEKIGEVVGTRISDAGHLPLARAVLDENFDF